MGKFEGVEEALARIGGHTYMMDAARSMTAGAVDLGEKPSVVSAIVKYHVTERARQVVNDGMDVIGGKGICLGPSNFLGRAYQQIPIGITVEGANILTRSLIIFGQGAIRCHPYVLAEMQAAQSSDRQQGLHDFDRAFWGHVGFVVKNKLRALGTALTGARLVGVNADVAPEMKRYYQQLSRYSAAFALLADTSMLVLGGSLKRRERLSARLGDILSQMYLISATLKRYQDEGRQAADAAGALVDPGRAVPPAGSLRRRAGKLPEPLRRLGPAPHRLPLGPSAIAALGRTGPAGRQAADQPGRRP